MVFMLQLKEETMTISREYATGLLAQGGFGSMEVMNPALDPQNALGEFLSLCSTLIHN